MNNIPQQTFATDSYHLASFLLAQSIQLLSINKSNPKRVTFIFEESTHRSFLTKEFFNYKAKVEPQRFISAQKSIKQMIFQ
jgi:hypothetical protein